MVSGVTVLKSLPRDAKILVSTRALRSFSAAIISVSFAIYLSKLGVSPAVIGLTFTGISLFSAFRSLLEGMIADRIGRKPVLLFSSGLTVIGGLLMTLTTNLQLLLILAVLFSIEGRLAYSPAEQAMLTESVTSEERTIAFSINAFLGTGASIFGSFAAGVPELLQTMGVSEIGSYQPIFIIFTAMGAITLVFVALIDETMSQRQRTIELPNGSVSDRDDRFLLMKWSGVVAVDIIGGSFTANFLAYWFYLRFNVGPSLIGVFFGLSRLLSTFSYILGFTMARSVGTIRATVLSRLPVVTVNILTPLMPSYPLAAMLRLFMSLFSMIDIPLRQSYVMGVIKSGNRASAAGIVTVVSKVTSASAPSITGYLYEHVSIAMPFYFSAAFQLASASLMYFLFKDIPLPEEKTRQPQS
jgi:MFS family permease